MSKMTDKINSTKTTTPPHVVIEALAGTGKTTTLIEGLNLLKGDVPNITPSEQQQAIWNALLLSTGARSICFVAFNKAIAVELQERVPEGVDAMTMHSMGFKAVMREFGKLKVNSYRVQDIISELLERDIRDIRKRDLEMLRSTEKLVSLCKMNMVPVDDYDDCSMGNELEEALDQLCSHYDIDTNGNRTRIYSLVPQVLKRCKDVDADRCLDFNDMIWLPVALKLPVWQYDLLLVDESQDLNRCQQSLARKAGRRLVLCGDTFQAIYGFAGADSESMNRMKAELTDTKSGCIVLPLTVTRRCGTAIVEQAQKIVPAFEAHESNGIGVVTHRKLKGVPFATEVPGEPESGGVHLQDTGYSYMVESGDMLLCRVNAPLVSQCFRFLREGRKAVIQGRDVGRGLTSTVNKMKAKDVADLVGKLDDWFHAEEKKELKKRNPSEGRLIALQDRYDCLMCFTEGKETVEAVTKSIESIFTDDKETVGIKLSTIHKAKGLEADRVFLLEPKGATVPHPMAKSKWQREQEMNLRYVAITRAKVTLVYVS